MAKTQVMRVQIKTPPPGKRIFEAERFYLLPVDEARELTDGGFAIDPDNPPPAPEPKQAPVIEVPLMGGEA